uniref:Large ribosomal subunit protein mL42 n=1 Tax=Prolemur simus TaxID=1328070 RepID=A0A8C9A9Q6_PROSS
MAAAVKWVISKRTILKHLFPIQNKPLYCVCHKSTCSLLSDDYNCKVELALTSDGRTMVCYHPFVDIPHEHTKPTLYSQSNPKQKQQIGRHQFTRIQAIV